MAEDVNQPVIIKAEDEGSKDWQTIYLEEKGAPLWSKNLNVEGHNIELINYDNQFFFTETHLQELQLFIKKAKEFNPYIINGFKKIVFSDLEPGNRYKGEAKVPISGTGLNTDDGIFLHRRGHRVDIPYRISTVSNFLGVVAHEVIHLHNRQIEGRWMKKFGWQAAGTHPEDWEQIGDSTSWKNIKTGWIAPNGWYTDRPEWCVTEYAKKAPDDDIAESGVAALFAPQLLESICPQKIEELKSLSKDTVPEVFIP